MLSASLISYGFSHHLFSQAAGLHHKVTDYRAVTPTYFSARTVELLRKVSPKLAQSLARRSHPNVPAAVVKTYPVEHARQILTRLRGQSFSFFSAHDRMAQKITRDFHAPKVIVSVDTGAEGLFEAWHKSSTCVLDLTIAVPQYREKIYREAEAQHAGSNVKLHYPGDWELSRYRREVELADLILCPSTFVSDSCRFMGVPEEKLKIIPYGFERSTFKPQEDDSPNPDAPIKFAFAGTFCHRKGSHLLLPAFDRLRQEYQSSELHIFGGIQDPPDKTPAKVTFHGHVPQSILAEQFHEMTAMVFPTFFEGSAYVVYQSLASGLPVITSHNCGSIVDESCGHILSDLSVESVYNSMKQVCENRAAWAEKGKAAPKIVNNYTWKDYSERLWETLEPLLNPSVPRTRN